jgi:hypothetical protein
VLIKKNHTIQTEKSIESILKSLNFWVEFKAPEKTADSSLFSTLVEFMNQNSSKSELTGRIEEDKKITISSKSRRYWTRTEVILIGDNPATIKLKFMYFYRSLFFGLLSIIFAPVFFIMLLNSISYSNPNLTFGVFSIIICPLIAIGIYSYLHFKQKRIIQIFTGF